MIQTYQAPKLVLHAGGRLATREQLCDLITPQGRTNTHVTIPHIEVVRQTLDRLAGLGVEIKSEAHALSHENNRYFGVFGIGNKSVTLPVAGSDGASAQDGYEMVLGLRNSHDCTFPAGLALGSRVFICDNLAFSGEVKISRKHTRYIMRDLPKLIMLAVGKVLGQRQLMVDRVQKYQEYEIDDAKAHDLVIRSLDHGVIGCQKIEKVLREWRKPAHEEFQPRNAWSLFNSFTEVMKDYDIAGTFKRSQSLHGMFDTVVGLAA